MIENITLDNYNALNDFLFFKYMCEEGNEKQQKNFLKAIGVPIKGELNIINQTLAPEIITNKKCILDSLSETQNSFIHIELQQNETIDFKERIVYYMSKIAKLKRGKKYTEFKNIVSIIIVNFKMNKQPHYKHEYMLINTENLNDIFIDKLKLIVIELEKFQKIEKDLDNKEHLYLTFFDKNTTHERRKESGKMDEGLKSAVKKIEEALQDDDALRLYHRLEWEKMVRENEKIRMKKEREEGIEEGRIKVATKLKTMGIPIQDIAKATDLSQEFIENL